MITARLATPEDDSTILSIVMHPEVRRWTEGDNKRSFDPKDYTAHPKSFAVMVHDRIGPLGVFLAPALEYQAYGVHTNLLPACRGANALRAAAAALETAFVRTDAQQLWSLAPGSNPQAKWFAHAMGFRDAYTRQDAWEAKGAKHAVTYLRMDIDDWIVSRPAGLVELGQRFHSRLVDRGGHVDHAEDPVHDAYVGAAWAMTAARRIDKGLHVYGRWARVAGYQPYTVLSVDPLRLDIGTCVLVESDGDFEIEETAHA